MSGPSVFYKQVLFLTQNINYRVYREYRTFGCGDTPSVFSRVSAGYDWLRYTICEESQSPPSYLGCSGVTDPQLSTAPGPPSPPQPIKFKWTFTPDDYNFENAYTLERIEGFDIRKVDSMVPGAIPYGFSSTYEREMDLQEGALYVWTISDANSDGLGLDSGGGTYFQTCQCREFVFLERNTLNQSTSLSDSRTFLGKRRWNVPTNSPRR